MRKVICVTLIIVIILLVGAKSPIVKGDIVKSKNITSSIYNNSELTKSLSNKLIRFHVLANSDSVEDQTLKLKVRDRVLDYIAPKLRKAKSLEESRKILKLENETIKKIAYEVIKQNGYSYTVKTILSSENFPIKSYGNITLPQGKYEAYRILIGKGNGQNWWCVMFPPLCFVDVTKGETSIKETEKLFGGGSGAGITITPVAFLIVNGGTIRLLQISDHMSTVDKLVEMVPDLFEKITSKFKSNNSDDEDIKF
jgi:stage II sporulation protein R